MHGRDRSELTLVRARALYRPLRSGEKIAPVDQPGSCLSHLQRPALMSTPATAAPATQSRHRPPGPRPLYVLSTAREPPVLRCPALANHHDRVTTSHLPGGKLESAAKTRTARLRRST